MGATVNPYSEYDGEQHSMNFFIWKVVQYFDLITLSNTSNFWIYIYDHVICNFFYQEKFKVTDVTDMFENSFGFSCNSVCLKFFFLGLFIIKLFKFRVSNFFFLYTIYFYLTLKKKKKIHFSFFSFFSLYIFIYHSKYYKLICMPCTMR